MAVGTRSPRGGAGLVVASEVVQRFGEYQVALLMKYFLVQEFQKLSARML